MQVSRTVLLPWGSYGSGGGAVQEVTSTVDLGVTSYFLAWVSLGYIGGRIGGAATSGPWDFDNAVSAEVFQVDGVIISEVDAFWSRFGPEGDWANYHSPSMFGRGRKITFRMRIWQPEEMEAIATGLVLFNF
jgi:hypothetical protein